MSASLSLRLAEIVLSSVKGPILQLLVQSGYGFLHIVDSACNSTVNSMRPETEF